MYVFTQTFMALAAALAVAIHASPLNARATGCAEFDNAPPGSVAQKNAIAACAARGVKVGGASGGNTSTSAVPKVESASAYGDGCFECGPASQFYKPGCHCENTLFVKRDAAPQACLPRSDCGPASQYYRPGCFCENTLFMKKRNAAPAANGCFECGPASVFYKPGCHCENTLFT